MSLVRQVEAVLDSILGFAEAVYATLRGWL